MRALEPLTPLDRETLKYVTTDPRDIKEISQSIGVSANTLHSRVNRLYKKFGFSGITRAAFVIRWYNDISNSLEPRE